MYAARPLHPAPSIPAVVVAVVASLVLHALVIAWPRWPTWDSGAGTFEGTAAHLRARLAGGAVSREAAGAYSLPIAPSEAGVGADAAQRPGSDPARAANARAAADSAAPVSAPASSVATSPLVSDPVDAQRAPRIVPRAAAAEQPAARAVRADRPRSDGGRQGESGRSESSPLDSTGAASPATKDPDAVAGVAVPVLAAAARSAKSTDLSPAARSDAGDRADIASIAQYRIALISVSRRYKPAEATLPAERPEGRVDVQLAIAADGSLADARVTRSSGQPLLDALALDMMRNAQAQAPVPPRLLEHAFEIEVPVIFGGAGAPR